MQKVLDVVYDQNGESHDYHDKHPFRIRPWHDIAEAYGAQSCKHVVSHCQGNLSEAVVFKFEVQDQSFFVVTHVHSQVTEYEKYDA